MKGSLIFLAFSCVFLLVAGESFQTKTVADLRIISPADIKINKDLFILNAYDKTFKIRVSKTVEFFGGNRLEQYKSVDGEETLTLTVVNEEEGILMGAFWRDGEMYHVQALSSHRKALQMEAVGFNLDFASKQVVYKESDVRADEDNKSFCGGLNPHTKEIEQIAVDSKMSKRQDASSTFASALPTLNCPTSPKTLVFSIALDASFISRVSGEGLQVEPFVRTMVSTMSDIYMKTVNVAFRVDEIVQFPTAGSPDWNSATCSDINTKLNQFSGWRGGRNANAGLWHLLTDCYKSGTVGLAWIDVLCYTQAYPQGSGHFSGTGVSSYLSSTYAWKILAHEVGHNFGSQHTNVGIMIASNIQDNVFSRASQQYMCDGVYNKGKCLTNSQCTPNCPGNCGSDGCGGSCGTCSSPSSCSSSGTCQTCQRNCNGRVCGDDGCGGSCGTCSSGSTCSTNTGTCTSQSSGGGGTSDTWVNLHNTERNAYGIAAMSWNTNAAATAQNYASQCQWGHNPNRGNFGENISARSGDARANIPLLFQGWADEKKNWDCANNAAINNQVIGHFTQIVWEASTGVGCAVVYCTTGSPFGSSFPTWTYAVCNYAPPGNYMGQRPFAAAKCSGSAPCTPTTSCSAQNRVCGTINDGCKSVDCGGCGSDSTCNTQGQCQCNPSGSCSSAGKSCGTHFDGCNTLTCGTCPTGSTCSSQGQCVQDTPPACTPSSTCESRGVTCGVINDGCNDVNCGACLTGETCMQGICKACQGCSAFSTCVNNQCQCLNGYQGDGITCEKIPETPVRGTDAWSAASGSIDSWTRAGTDLVNSDNGVSSLYLIGSGSKMTGDSAVTWRAKILRQSDSADAGLLFGTQSGYYWVFSLRPSTAVLYAICGSQVCSGIYTIGNGNFPSNQWLDVSISIRNTNAATFTVNGAQVGGTWTYGSGTGWLGDLGVYSNGGSASFQETLLKTSSYLSISLVECLTPEEFSEKIAAILRVDKSQVPPSSVTSNCNKRQAATGSFVYSFELLGSSQASAPSLASELSTKLYSNHPALSGNGISAASSVQVSPVSLSGAQVAAITGGAVAAAAALSTGAIIAIAVGGGVGLAAVGGGAVAAGVVIKRRREENSIPMETQGRRIDLLSSPEQNGFTSITARGVTQQ